MSSILPGLNAGIYGTNNLIDASTNEYSEGFTFSPSPMISFNERFFCSEIDDHPKRSPLLFDLEMDFVNLFI